jgi:hypothetical protein
MVMGDLAAKIHEVILDEANDMEAFCNDACVRKDCLTRAR